VPQEPSRRRKRYALLRWLWSLANLLLFLLLALQVFVLTLFRGEGEAQLPLYARQWVVDYLAEKGLHVQAGDIRLNVSGEVFIRDLRLAFAEDGEDAVQARAVVAEYSLPMLLAGDFLPNRLRIVGGRLYCPAWLSPTGERTSAVEKVAVDFSHAGERTDVHRLSGYIGQARFSASGVVMESWVEALREDFLEEEPEEEKPIKTQIENLAVELERLNRRLQPLEKPVLHLRLREEEGQPALTVQGEADAVQHEGVVAKELRVQGFYHPGSAQSRLDAFVESITQGGNQAGRSVFSVDLPADEAGLPQMPSQAYFSSTAIKAEAFGEAIPHVHGALAMPVEDSLPLTISAWLPEAGEVTASGLVNTTTQTAEVSFTGRVFPFYIFQTGFIEKQDFVDLFQFAEPLRISGTAHFSPGFTFEEARARAEISHLTVHTADVTAAFAKLEADPHELRVRDAWMETPEWSVRADIFYTPETGDYRVLVDGGVDPWAINPFFPSWWAQIFERIQFSGAWPHANVDIIANQHDPRDHYIYGTFTGRDGAYRGVPVDTAALKLWFPPGHLVLFDLDGRSRYGAFNGELHWYYPSNAEHGNYFFFADVNSTLPLHQFSRAIDEKVVQYTQAFELTGAPEIALRGFLYGPSSPWDQEPWFDISVRTAQPLTAQGYRLEWVDFDSQLRQDAMYFSRLEMGLAGGTALGEGSLLYQNDQYKLDFDLRLRDAWYAQLLRDVPFFEGFGAESTEPPDALTMEERIAKTPGKIALDLAFQGIYEDLSSFHAKGHFHLTDAQLGELDIFGMLSKMTGLARFNLTEARARYELSQSTIHFADITIDGSNAEIRGSGLMSLPTSGLYFRALVNPFGASQLPLFGDVAGILGTVGKTFEVKLQGTLKEPVWNVNFRPWRIFNKKGQVDRPDVFPLQDP